MASCRAYSTINGVMIPGVSAGSNQVGASVVCTPQVSCPCGPAAKVERGTPATRPSAVKARTSRRAVQRDVLVRTRIGVTRYQAEPRLTDPGSDAVDERELPDRRVDRPLVN